MTDKHIYNWFCEIFERCSINEKHYIQNPMLARACGFESHLWYKSTLFFKKIVCFFYAPNLKVENYHLLKNKSKLH